MSTKPYTLIPNSVDEVLDTFTYKIHAAHTGDDDDDDQISLDFLWINLLRVRSLKSNLSKTTQRIL
jgi:hypothetical protein